MLRICCNCSAVINAKVVRMLAIDRCQRPTGAAVERVNPDLAAPCEGDVPFPQQGSCAGEMSTCLQASGLVLPEQPSHGQNTTSQPLPLPASKGAQSCSSSLDADKLHDLDQHGVFEDTLDFKSAFWLATLGGAEALGLQVCMAVTGIGLPFGVH